MRPIHPKKRLKAFQMRVEGFTLAEIARKTGIGYATLKRLENGYTDRKNIRHAGWKARLEQARAECAKAEIESGFALREERIKAFKRLFVQVLERCEKGARNVNIKTANDFKAIHSELRGLNRALDELTAAATPEAEKKPRGEVTLEDIQGHFKRARAVEPDDIEMPEAPEDVPPEIEGEDEE